MNIFEALRLSHDIQRAQLDQILQTQGDSPDRRRIYTELKRELAAHAAAEEEWLALEMKREEAEAGAPQ